MRYRFHHSRRHRGHGPEASIHAEPGSIRLAAELAGRRERAVSPVELDAIISAYEKLAETIARRSPACAEPATSPGPAS